MAAELYAAPPPPTKGKIIGVDCHPDTYAAAVFQGSSPHDARKLTSRENLSLESFLKWASKEFTREDLFLMEAGSNSFEIHRRLMALGLRAVVLESCYMGKHVKTYADNDKMAAARIALVYLGAKVPCVWVPDTLTCERRELLSAHQKAVADHTAALNSLKGYLNQFAIRLGKRGIMQKQTREWILKQREWSTLQHELLTQYLRDLDNQAERRKGLLCLIAQQVCGEPLMLRCMKLLGIGVINAFALLAVIGDVRRFERPEKLVAYIGLNPGQRDSGTGKRIKLGVGNRGRSDMRHLIVQGAHSVLRMGRSTTLGQWGWKLFARKGHRNIAVAAIARKMMVQVWHLLMGNPPTALEPDKSQALKFRKLIAILGLSLREKLGLPSSIAKCILALQTSMLAGVAPAPPGSRINPA